MRVQIKKVEDASKGDNHWKVITYEKDGQDKQKAVFLKDKYSLLVEGATVELVMQKNLDNPKYWDITDIKPATFEEAVKKEESSQYAFKYYEQQQMMIRTALMQACATEQSHDVDSILKRADKFLYWENNGGVPEKPTEPSPSEAEGPPGPVVAIETPKGSDVSDEGYGKTFNSLCTKLGWTKSRFLEFTTEHKDRWGGKVDVEDMNPTERTVLKAWLDSEVKKIKK